MIFNFWGSSLESRRNLHVGFIMGYRGGFSRKMQKTGGGGAKSAHSFSFLRVTNKTLCKFVFHTCGNYNALIWLKKKYLVAL